MRKIYVLVWCLFLTATALGQQTKPLTLIGRVIDFNARPLAGAEVAAYEKLYNYSSRQEYTKLLDQTKKTDVNGYFVLNAEISSQRNVFIVARKKGLAVGWDVLSYSRSDEPQGNFNIILEPPCVLAGVVVDETGNPVAAAKVQAVPKTSYLSRLEQRPVLAPEQWFTTQTDAKGNFSFHNFAADVSADLWVKAPGWSSVYQYTTHWTSSCGFEAGRTDIRLVLPREVAIRGRVIDAESGSPVTGAVVFIKPDNTKEHKNPYRPNQTISGQNGQFHFEGVPPGKHYINCLPPQTTELVDKRVKFDVQADQEAKEITVALDKGGLIEIIAREEETKKPVSNLPIYFWQAIQDEHSNFYKYAITGKEGRLRIWAPPGECKLSTSYDRRFLQTYENQVIVAKGQTAKLEVVLNSYPSVSGLVLDEAGQPVPGVLVEEVLTNEAGGFKVGFNPSSPRKTLIARHIERNLAAIVDVKDYSKPLTVIIKPALSITGKVTDANGVGIPAARLSLCVNLPGTLLRFGAEMLTNYQGRYVMAAVPPPAGFGYRLSVYASGYGSDTYKRVSIMGEPGKTVEMETIVLQSADLSISGVVVDAEGKPAVRVPVFLHPVKGQPSRSTATGNNGRFSIKRVCKGPLRLQANFDSSPGGSGSVKTESFEQNIKIILGQIKFYRSYISLVGKPLPEIEDLKIDLSPADVSGKMILVCFWDMQQRPSRNCIKELAKRAEELKEKGVAVIAVQASKVDENELNEWVKKYNIPFTVGMVQGDVEKTRFTWGVKSLPWLILTNPQHIVRAEDFGLAELDEKISANTQK